MLLMFNKQNNNHYRLSNTRSPSTALRLSNSWATVRQPTNQPATKSSTRPWMVEVTLPLRETSQNVVPWLLSFFHNKMTAECPSCPFPPTQYSRLNTKIHAFVSETASTNPVDTHIHFPQQLHRLLYSSINYGRWWNNGGCGVRNGNGTRTEALFC